MLKHHDPIAAIAIFVSLALAIMGNLTDTNTIAYAIPTFNFGLGILMISSTLYWVSMSQIDEVAYIPLITGIVIILLLAVVSIDTIRFNEWQGANNFTTIIMSHFHYFGTVVFDMFYKKLKK